MMFSIFILATVVAAIWRMESLDQRNAEMLTGLFSKFGNMHQKQAKELEELKAFVDKHIKNGGIEEYKRLTQESIERQLQDAAIKPMQPEHTYELVVSTIEAPKKKVANKRRKKK